MRSGLLALVLAALLMACGGDSPPPQDPESTQDVDVDVDLSGVDLAGDLAGDLPLDPEIPDPDPDVPNPDPDIPNPDPDPDVPDPDVPDPDVLEADPDPDPDPDVPDPDPEIADPDPVPDLPDNTLDLPSDAPPDAEIGPDTPADTPAEIADDVPPPDPCLGASCDDGDPCTEDLCENGLCVSLVSDAATPVPCGPAHTCLSGLCMPACTGVEATAADLLLTPGSLTSETCAWQVGQGWSPEGGGASGTLSAPELQGLHVFRLDLLATLGEGGRLLVGWPLQGGASWRSVILDWDGTATVGTGATLGAEVSVEAQGLGVTVASGSMLSILRHQDGSLDVLLDGLGLVAAGALPGADPEILLTLGLDNGNGNGVTQLTGWQLQSIQAACDDANPCTDDTCDWSTGLCGADPVDGGPCAADALACTLDLCADGECAHPLSGGACLVDGVCYQTGQPDPTNPCGVCDPDLASEGFSSQTVPVGCDDGDPCTEDDTCQGLGCAGSPLDCDDGSTCTLDQCAGGICQNLSGLDGLYCEEGSLCQSGACVEGCLGPPELAETFEGDLGDWVILAGSWAIDEEAQTLVQDGGGPGGVTHPALSGVVTFDLEITATIDQDAPALGTQGVFRVDVYAGAFEPGVIPRYRIQYQTNHPVFGGSAVLLFSGPGFLVQVDQTVIDLSVGQVFSFGLRITPDRRVTATLDGEITVDLTDLGGLPESFTIAAGFDQHGTLDDVSLVASGVFCDDGLACTDDTCQVDGSCTAPLLASTCLIGGVCYPVSMPAPDNPCAICVPETPLAWSPAAGDESLIECETGDGCEIDGACATDSTSCQGQPLDCDDLDACTSDTCAAGLCEHDPIPGCGIDPDASDGSDGTDATDATEDIGPEAA